jgi:hypothetical protein
MYNLRISASRLNTISRKLLKEMAPQVGLEPTTLRLTAGCSAIELLRSVAECALAWQPAPHQFLYHNIILGCGSN